MAADGPLRGQPPNRSVRHRKESAAHVEPKVLVPAKRYGWGWGLPSTWQGWVVLLAYVALVLGGIPFVKASKGNVAYVGYVLALTVMLIACAGSRASRRGGVGVDATPDPMANRTVDSRLRQPRPAGHRQRWAA